jgi:hypothetical protein
VDALQILDQLERSISSENPVDHLVSMLVTARLDRRPDNSGRSWSALPGLLDTPLSRE